MDWRVFSFKAPPPFACGGVVSLIRTCYSFFVCISSVFIPPSRRSSLKCTANMVLPTPPTPPSPPQEHIAAGRGSRPHHFPSCLVENLQKGVKCCALPYKRYTVLVQKITDLVGGPLLQTKVLVKNMQSKTSIGIFVQEEVRGVAQRQRSPHHFFPECFFLRSHRSTQMQIGRKWPKWLLSPNKSSQ